MLVVLQKLSAPASEESMRKEHQKLLRSFADIASSNDKPNQSFVIAAIKGLRFVLDEIQVWLMIHSASSLGYPIIGALKERLNVKTMTCFGTLLSYISEI